MDIFSSGSGTGVFNTGSFNFENIGSIFQEDGISGAFSGILGGGSGSDALSGAVSGVAGGAIEGIAGDALGGVVGGIGGGKVPVADAAVKKATDAVKKATNEVRESQDEGNTNTEVIEAKTTELIEKECNRDPAIAMAARALAAESSASTIDAIFDSSSSPIQDFAAFDRDTYKAGLLMFVSDYDGPHKDSVKRYLETQIAAAEGGGPTTPPNCGTDGLSRLFQGGLRMFGGCDEIGSREAAKSRAMQAGSKAREAALRALTFDYRPKVAECVVDGVTYDDLDHCPTSPILTSASDIKALSQEAQKEGRELDRNADEPGELGRSGDTGLRNLIETVLGNFGGLRGLTERDRGASQSGTYLKRLQNEAENVSLDSASGSIKGNITGAIVLEGAFQNKLKSSVVALEKNAKAFEDIRACFASLTQQPQNLATPIAQAAENASTTANALLKKAKTNKDLITDSRDLVTELSELLSRLTSGEEAGITEIAEERFTFLSITGEIHTNAQYTAFSIEADAALLALSVSLTDANAQLAACEAYP
jgi:hypothetical protein